MSEAVTSKSPGWYEFERSAGSPTMHAKRLAEIYADSHGRERWASRISLNNEDRNYDWPTSVKTGGVSDDCRPSIEDRGDDLKEAPEGVRR